MYLGRGNKCDAIFITPEEERATVFPGTSDRGYESLPVITEVKLGWMGTEEIPVVESEELHVKRDKQAVLEVVCDWAKENRVPAVYYKQPDTDGELLVMDTRQISVEVVQHHVKPPSANMSAIGQSGYDKPRLLQSRRRKSHVADRISENQDAGTLRMQNRYIADVGDFGKYGLLRALCGNGPINIAKQLSLGVVWYLVVEEEQNNDGKFVDYLNLSARNQEQFRFCDPVLYDSLRKIIQSQSRHVTSIKEAELLPPDTMYYDNPLFFAKSKYDKVAIRENWLSGALDVTQGRDLVFLDPDNGLEVQASPTSPKGPKYTFFEEMQAFTARNQSLIVYHHIGRRGSAREQIEHRFSQIKERLGREATALLYHRGSARVFFIIPADQHKETLAISTARFLDSHWRRHFELFCTKEVA